MVRAPADALDAAALRRWCSACVDALDYYCEEIDGLNVYPIPDGDTGTNLLMTLRGSADLLRRELPSGTAQTAAVMARGALLGARGNSGVIVSQILRGLAEAFAVAPTPPGGDAVAEGLARAVVLAYDAVAEPVEGTVLTVARAAAEAAKGAGTDELSAVVSAAAAAAAEALALTPGQLPALARAGVVDAGGRGLVVLLDALVGVVTGSPAVLHPPARPPKDTRALQRARESGSAEFGYEVQYLLSAESSAVQTMRAALAGLGDSLVVVGSGDGLWRVHVHVNDVGAAIEAGVRAGRPEGITVTRFDDQIEAERVDEWVGRAAVAVAPGEGLGDLFEAEGVHVVHGGASSNPSTAEVLTAIQQTGAAQVVVLPNHGNVTGVADAAAAQAREGGQDVAVVPTRSPVQGLAAVAVADPARRFADDVIAMAEAAAATRWAEVTIAVRDSMTSVGRCRAGDALGLADGDVVLIGESVGQVACDLVDRLLIAGGELATVIVGVDAPPGLAGELAAHLKRAHPTVEVVVYHGGQPHYPLLLGIE
ncbi:MAG: DAK2 domain-containing protein [Geodermatophilaceae bacterium]